MEAASISVENLNLTAEQHKAVVFLTEYSKQMVVMGFQEGNSPASVSILVKEIYRFCDEIVAGSLRNGTRPACQKGCSWCCFLRVRATPLEVVGIIDYLQSSLAPGELSMVRQRLAETDVITRGLDGQRRVQTKKICPLSEDDQCLVYPVRPIACRMYHSLEASDCMLSLEDDRHSLRIRPDISCVGIGICEGLAEGLSAVGLQAHPVELIAGMRTVLDEPEVANRWLAGEAAFKEAEIK